MKRLLLLGVSAGAGHQRAAAALAAWGAGRAEIQHWDVLDFVSATFRKVYADAYIRLVNNHPEWWRLVYTASGSAPANSAGQRLRRLVERGSTRALIKAVHVFRPDRIVCTHFLPAEILSHEIAGAAPAFRSMSRSRISTCIRCGSHLAWQAITRPMRTSPRD